MSSSKAVCVPNTLFRDRGRNDPSFADYTTNPTLSLFMWESGSFFDSLCNEIQNHPAAIRPSLALRHLASAAMGNGTALLNATLTRPKTAVR